MTCIGMCRRTRDSMPQAWDRSGKPSRSQAPLLAGARSVQHQCSRCMHVERETKANRKVSVCRSFVANGFGGSPTAAGSNISR